MDEKRTFLVSVKPDESEMIFKNSVKMMMLILKMKHCARTSRAGKRCLNSAGFEISSI